MSGGEFNYEQDRIREVADHLKFIIDHSGDKTLNGYGEPAYSEFPDDILDKFRKTEFTLRLAANMLHRVDWLLCGDDGENTFREHWKEIVTETIKKFVEETNETMAQAWDFTNKED